MRTKFNIDKAYPTFKHLIWIVEEEYIWQMKKCIILKDMASVDTHEKYKSLKIPIWIPAPIVSQYSGLVVDVKQFIDNETGPYNWV